MRAYQTPSALLQQAGQDDKIPSDDKGKKPGTDKKSKPGEDKKAGGKKGKKQDN
jgi:hypothetical protein